MTKYSPEITGTAFRKDGIFAALGEASGKMKILDLKRKVYTRDHSKHTKAVHALAFASEGTILGSAGDDKNIIFYDYSVNEIVKVFPSFHNDNIRVLRSFPDDMNLFLTGSHDFTMKILDLREAISTDQDPAAMDLEIGNSSDMANQSSLVFNHGCEVEDIAIFPMGGLFVSVGGMTTKLWDIRRNDKPVSEISANTKSVSCVQIVQSGKRVLTGSYDQFLKIYDSEENLKIVHQQKMAGPIMNIAVTHSMESLAFAYADGSIEILNRKLDSTADKQTDNDQDWEVYEKKLIANLTFGAAAKDTSSRRFFGRGLYATPGDYSTKVDAKLTKRLQKFDRLLRKFKYGEAIQEALVTKNTTIILSIVEEIIYRNGLEKALEKCFGNVLLMLLQFVLKKIDSGNCQKFVMYLFGQILGHCDFKRASGEEERINDVLRKIEIKIGNEVEVVEKTLELKGILEALDF